MDVDVARSGSQLNTVHLNLSDITAETFTPYEDRLFRFEADGERFELALSRVQIAGTAVAGRRAAFSVLFTGPSDVTFRQGMGRLTADGFGEVELFLTRVMPSALLGLHQKSGVFEAVFG